MTGNGVVPCPWQNCPQGGPMRVANDMHVLDGLMRSRLLHRSAQSVDSVIFGVRARRGCSSRTTG